MTFVVKGLSEIYGSRGATTIPRAGSEIARVTSIARTLVAEPDLRGLTALQRSQIANWNIPAQLVPPFSVVEKTADEMQDALTRGLTTSEDVVRDYLQRLTVYDRNGPALRAMLALNPRAIAEARALDAERAAGRLRSYARSLATRRPTLTFRPPAGTGTELK